MDLRDELIRLACDNRASAQPLSRFGIFPVFPESGKGERLHPVELRLIVDALGDKDQFQLQGRVGQGSSKGSVIIKDGERQKVGGRAIRGSLERWLKQSPSNA